MSLKDKVMEQGELKFKVIAHVAFGLDGYKFRYEEIVRADSGIEAMEKLKLKYRTEAIVSKVIAINVP